MSALLTGCSGDAISSSVSAAPLNASVAPSASASYAIVSEFARNSNKLMQPGVNRRVFNMVEAHSGSDIQLAADGSLSLAPGTYHISGFSLVTMQTTFAPPQPQHDTNYPGYCLLYPTALENGFYRCEQGHRRRQPRDRSGRKSKLD